MPLSKHRAKRLGREHGRKSVQQAQDAARDFLRIVLAEGIYELEKEDLSNDDFDELLLAAARKMPAVVRAAARRAVHDAIRETDPSSYSITFDEGGGSGCSSEERVEVASSERLPSTAGQSGDEAKLSALKIRAALLDQQFVTREEAATVLSVSVDTIDRLCEKRKLRRKTVGRKPYIITKSIEDALSCGPTITEGLTVLTSKDLRLRQKLRKD